MDWELWGGRESGERTSGWLFDWMGIVGVWYVLMLKIGQVRLLMDEGWSRVVAGRAGGYYVPSVGFRFMDTFLASSIGLRLINCNMNLNYISDPDGSLLSSYYFVS